MINMEGVHHEESHLHVDASRACRRPRPRRLVREVAPWVECYDLISVVPARERADLPRGRQMCVCEYNNSSGTSRSATWTADV